jgi:hypothetical protein
MAEKDDHGRTYNYALSTGLLKSYLKRESNPVVPINVLS